MAQIKCRMTALGNEPYECPGCDKKFERGSRMNAVEYDDGEPAGWLCDSCVDKWKSGKLVE